MQREKWREQKQKWMTQSKAVERRKVNHSEKRLSVGRVAEGMWRKGALRPIGDSDFELVK